MTVPYSDIPDSIVQQYIWQALHALGDLEHILVDYEAEQTAVGICTDSLLLLNAIKDVLERNPKQTILRLNSTIEHLVEIRNSMLNTGDVVQGG